MSNSETGGIHNKLEVAIHHSLPGRTLESGVSFFFYKFLRNENTCSEKNCSMEV